jgi:hypothetical protein
VTSDLHADRDDDRRFRLGQLLVEVRQGTIGAVIGVALTAAGGIFAFAGAVLGGSVPAWLYGITVLALAVALGAAIAIVGDRRRRLEQDLVRIRDDRDDLRADMMRLARAGAGDTPPLDPAMSAVLRRVRPLLQRMRDRDEDSFIADSECDLMAGAVEDAAAAIGHNTSTTMVIRDRMRRASSDYVRAMEAVTLLEQLDAELIHHGAFRSRERD